jgi:hypothetical protein
MRHTSSPHTVKQLPIYSPPPTASHAVPPPPPFLQVLSLQSCDVDGNEWSDAFDSWRGEVVRSLLAHFFLQPPAGFSSGGRWGGGSGGWLGRVQNIMQPPAVQQAQGWCGVRSLLAHFFLQPPAAFSSGGAHQEGASNAGAGLGRCACLDGMRLVTLPPCRSIAGDDGAAAVSIVSTDFRLQSAPQRLCLVLQVLCQKAPCGCSCSC